MRDYLMMRDMARAYEGLIMTNNEKVKVDVTKVNELLDDSCIKDTDYYFEGDLTGGNCLEFNKQDHKIVADFKPLEVTDET